MRVAEGRKSPSEKRNTLLGQMVGLAILLVMRRHLGGSYVLVAVWATWAVYQAIVMYAGAGREQVERE